jgi:hypothetical protein
MPPRARTDRTGARAALSTAALSAWVVALFTGWVLGGAVHLLLVAAIALFPWRAALGGSAPRNRIDPEDDPT